MPNFKMSIDLSDLQNDLKNFDLREYRLPFCLYFIEADNPDDACSTIMMRLMRSILKEENSIKNRILCRKVRKYFRIDKIQSL